MTANHYADRADRMHERLLARCWGMPPPENETPRSGGTEARGEWAVGRSPFNTSSRRADQWISGEVAP